MLLFNRYQYQPSTDLIGKGELTRVYKALDKQIYLPVAVKIYRGNDPNEKFGLVQMNKFIAMDHPNICRYLHIEEMDKESAFGEKEKTQVCVMELVPDGDFASYFRARRSQELLRKMVTDILRGLAYLHSQGIVHRRLKPSNLLVGETTQGPVVKITDFGLGSGKAALRDARLSSIVVEVTHMAPEQFNPKKYGVNGKVTYHLDFWQLGIAVYEALTDNDVLFKNSPEDSQEQVIQNILAPTLPEKIHRLPPPFDAVVARCLAKHADDRAQNTRELLELLSQPITEQDDVYETLVLPAMAAAAEEGEKTEEEEVTPTLVATTPDAGMPSLVGTTTVAGAQTVIVTPAAVATRGDVAETVVVAPAKVPLLEPKPAEESHTLFNRYDYNPRTGLIGKGGFSRVYKAFDKKLGRWVALKFYKTGEFSDKYSPIAEIRRVINLDHPNICRYLDIEEIEKENGFGEKEITQICVMELLDGGNLLEFYTGHRTDEVLKKLLTDVLKGLVYLHKNGIIHRDIKPANILIKEGYDGVVAKITDFGISKGSDSVNHHSNSALVVSIPYMAPEQLNVKKYGIDEKISYNLDLWSLGVTIYEIVTGKILFKNGENDSSEQIMTNIMAPELPEKILELPQPFLDIVRRCVVKDARERVQRAEELIEMLAAPVPSVVVPVSSVVAPEPEVEPLPEIVAAVPSVVAPTVEVVAPEPEVVAPVEVVEVPEPAVVAHEALAEVHEPVAVAHEPVAEVKTSELRVVAAEPAVLISEPVSGSHHRWVVGLRIAVIAAAVLVAISFYIFMQNKRLKEVENTISAQKADSVSIVSGQASDKPPAAAGAAAARPVRTDSTKRTGTSGKAGASGAAGTTGASSARAAGTSGTAGNTGAAGASDAGNAEKKPHREKKERESAESPGVAPAKYVLLLSTPTTCTITINNAPYGVLESGKTMKVYLAPGNYVIQATGTGGSSAAYTGRLVVTQENQNQVGKYKIPL